MKTKKTKLSLSPEDASDLPEESRRVWGYGFEPTGKKFRAYRVDGGDVAYLSPARGEELHSVGARIREALARDIMKAVRERV